MFSVKTWGGTYTTPAGAALATPGSAGGPTNNIGMAFNTVIDPALRPGEGRASYPA